MRSRCPASILTHTRTRTHTHADTHGHAQAHPIPLRGAPSPLCAQRPGSHLHSLPRAAHGADSQPRARTTRSLRPRWPRARVTSELRARGVAHAWTPAFQHGATCHLPAPKGNRRHGGPPRPDPPGAPTAGPRCPGPVAVCSAATVSGHGRACSHFGRKQTLGCPVRSRDALCVRGQCSLPRPRSPPPCRSEWLPAPPALEQTLGQPARPRGVGPAGRGAGQPAAAAEPGAQRLPRQGFRCFPGNPNPEGSSGPSISHGVTRPGSVSAR